MMRRDVIRLAIEGKQPPYVPWSFSFTHEARENLQKHFGMEDLDPVLHGHIVGLGEDFGIFEDLG